ncbi:hypothetical protein [Sinomicrobium weinanense]|uniref:Uncharacterized protein n=1 Tax=Sinomicrobium weinanense TaxID=2842200 RepID=A0A926JR81_9FLAO|nr:hypothetical protein [Sinomicrobium weinanense]MBC9795889.1 hypothetical protein [Sinomicrobium weinanense]MBU3124732.1 hypothetical protein [Sinomicrobium weinanense]
MKNDREYLDVLLGKLRSGTMTEEEFEHLKAYMGRPETEQEIKQLMDEHWKEIAEAEEEEDFDGEEGPDEEDDPFDEMFSLN